MTAERCTIHNTSFQFDGVKGVYHGKVRDVYDLGDQLLMVATDRISAFDHVLPKAIPYKGQVLNQIAQHFLLNTKDIVPNWWVASPDPNVTIGQKAETIKIEMVIRGYLSGHAWRTYKSGERILCGVRMPEGLKENDRFPDPIITPTTKASEGHDMDISVPEIIRQVIISQKDWDQLEKYTRALFERGTKMAADRGLILVDTKYEFGKVEDQIILIDEIHTPDSSRYFYLEGYDTRQINGDPQPQLSKEFVREWLIANGFQGLEGQKMPDMPDEFVWEISDRYIQLYELITGHTFIKAEVEDIKGRIEKNINNYLND
ncbi:MAG: phosphoribosylaminoimidazolesuccinocarboxamide synthase [Saprospiraceae bacterium]|nr:phosphoribosylaminoimidazolesuccinocarboxamide synthase [Saprospiraceae bacterium]MBP6567343.1 phosphoribosylaminoimidazolesuccinocarboxamide synthase [Saprospiraceae bacterium]MBP9196997.1 phosphoribosylaminoimidazolesuccinocarboxamide synthase [Saprospiraceae bacterium]